ncbi:MAG: hypothetical protein RLZZ618_3394 [Pseudomonadota bacterium]
MQRTESGGWRIGPLVLGASALLSLALLAGRLAGFGRELILASALGVSPDADLAVLLLTLPDLLVNLLLSGGLSVALIPALKAMPGPQAASLFRQASLAVGGAFALLALVIAVTPSWWLGALAPGADFSVTASSLAYVPFVALAVPLTALAGVSTAYLNARERFFVAGSGTLLFNLCVIAGLMAAAGAGVPILWLCLGIFGGALVRWLSQVVALPRDVWRRESVGVLLDSSLMKAFVTAFLSASLMLLVPVLVRGMASFLGQGTIATFNYATKLIELPVGILITTLATVAFPRLSALYAAAEPAQAHQVLRTALRRSALLSAAVLLAGVWFADAVVALLFLRGRIDAGAVSQITLLTQVAMASIPFVGISSLAAASLNAQRRTGDVLRVTAWCLALLPLLAAPGLWWYSPALLMGAVVAFQAILALGLVAKGGIRWTGPAGWLDRRMLGCILLMFALALPFYGMDSLLAPQHVLVRTLLAVALFLATAFVGVRFLSKGPAPENSVVR